jgi:Predicted signal transduction protein with a C-terminal ATPase domain
MILSFLLVVAIAVVSFMLVSINQSSKAIKETSVDYTHQLINMVNENIDSYIENMENISQIVTKNSDVREFLMEDTSGFVYLDKVEEQFITLKETRKDIYNIGILGHKGNALINTRDTRINPYVHWNQLDWYRKSAYGAEVTTSSHVQNLVYDEYPWVVTMSKAITNPETQEIIGVFFVDLNYRSINDLAENLDLGQKGYVYIVDDLGNIVYHPKQQLLYSGLWKEDIARVLNVTSEEENWEADNKLYSVTKSESTGWSVVGVTDLEEMSSGTRELVSLYYFMAICLIVLATWLAIVLTNKITSPLRNLQRSMRAAQNGQFEVEIIEDGSQNEIGDLIYSFQLMIREIEQLIERSTKEQEEKRLYELNALQAQISPHFLYNTLDSIIWMAEGSNTKDVILMTSALAKLLRKSISNDKELVTVAEEIEYTRSYLIIQKMRYRDKLEYLINMDAVIVDVEIIKLVIQPLVENAIYHGIKCKSGIGTIQITAEYKHKGIMIEIADDGAGMTKEQLEHIFDERAEDRARKSVGVLNVHKRIQLSYGTEYGLSFQSERGSGTTVSIYLPDRTGRSDYEK